MPIPSRHLALSSIACLSLCLPGAARAASLTISDTLISISECLDRNNQDVTLSSWSFSGSSGSTINIYGSNTSGCDTSASSSSVTTTTLVDNLSSSRTSYPSSGETNITLADLLSAAGKTVSDCEGSDFYVYVCVKLLDSSGSVVSTASAGIKFQVERPPPPVSVSTAVSDQGLWVSWTAGDATTNAPASSASYKAFASAGGQTFESGETSNTTARVGGLQNDTTYDVWVVAYSSAGNASAKSDLTAGTPRQVYDFYDLYTSSGGSTSGGCGQGGSAGFLSLVALGWLAARKRQRSERRGKASFVPAMLASATAGLVSCASTPPTPAAERRPDRAASLPSSSVAAVLAKRADLGLTEREIAALEEINVQLARKRLELQADAGTLPGNRAGGRGEMRREPGGASRPSGADAGPPGGAGGAARRGMGPGGMPGGGPGPGGSPPGAGPSAPSRDELERERVARLDEADTGAYWQAEAALDPAHREPARAVAATYREALYEQREAARRAAAR